MGHRQRGQITKRGNSRLVRVWLGRDASGQRITHNHTVRGTKRDAQQYLTGALRDIDLGVYARPSKLTLDEFLARSLTTALKPRVRAQTFRQYDDLLARYVCPRLGRHQLGKITPLDIQQTYAALTADGLSARSVRYVADDGGGIRKDAHHVRSAFDLLVQPLKGIRAVQLPLILKRHVPIREEVFRGLFEEDGGARERVRRPSATFRNCVIAEA